MVSSDAEKLITALLCGIGDKYGTSVGERPATIRLSAPMMGAIDSWIASQPQPQPSRSEAVALLVRRALIVC